MALQQLLTAARDDDADLIRSLVDVGMPVNAANQIGQTALHVAAVQGSLKAAQELLALGIDCNLQNRFGQTPLHFAVHAHRNVRLMCELLLGNGAESIPDEQGQLPYELASDDELRALLGGPDPRLFEVARTGDVAGLRQLLKEGPDVDVDCFGGDGFAPIHLAARGGHAGIAALLLAAGGFVDMQTLGGYSALHVAVEHGHLPLVALLLDEGANPNLQNFQTNEYSTGSWLVRGEALQPLHQTPLHLAVETGHLDIVRQLLSGTVGSDPNLPDWDGKTPLHAALEMQDEELVGLLLQHGGDPNKGCKDFASPLAQAAAGGMVSIVELLLGKGAAVDAADEQGWTPLMLAVRRGKGAAVRACIQAGADVARQNAQGDTALHLAAINNRAEIAQQLLAAGGASRVLGLRNGDGQTPAEAARTPEVAALLQAAVTAPGL